MAYTVMLDTSAVIELLKRKNEKVMEAIRNEEREEVVISAITKFELEVATDKDKDKLRTIPCTSAHCSALSLAAEIYADLSKKGKKPPLKDCLIAGCAIDSDAVLITCDKDFELFKGYGLKAKIV